MKAEYSVRQLCEALEVAPSAFYDWQHRQRHPGGRALEEVLLSLAIARIHQESRRTYGSPRIRQALARSGRAHGRNRIARLMRQQGLCGRAKRRFRVRTTDSRHGHPIAPNLLAQRPAPRKPNQVWVADITYIATDQGWLYLSGIMDLFSRKIVGWALEPSLDSQLVLASWKSALHQRRPPARLLVHSDRGCQYASDRFRRALAQAQAVPSMSRSANCYDNAAMESFWSTLKHELVYRRRFATQAEAQQAIASYIDGFYNHHRLHSSLNFLSPVDFEALNN